MPFFNINGSGTNSKKLKRIETAIWVLIYGGLLSFSIGHFTAEAAASANTAHVLRLLGLLAVLIGVALIYVRSRLREEDKPTGDKP
jgi:uncharacterized protein YjeT (DUF2065 family)